MKCAIEKLINQYPQWIQQNTFIKDIDDYFEITTPFLDRRNDHIQIYVLSKKNNTVKLTDDSYTLDDLELSGIDLSSEKYKDLIDVVLMGFGVHRVRNEIFIEVEQSLFSQSKHRLIQSILAINDLFYISKKSKKIKNKKFSYDVFSWLDSNQIKYIPNIKLEGESGLDFIFDCCVEKSKEKELLIKSISFLNKDSVRSLSFAWADLKKLRPPKSKVFALINDEKRIDKNNLLALEKWKVEPVMWSEKDELIKDLAA